MTKKRINFFEKLISLILVLFVAFGLFSNAPLARAQETYSFDNTDVMTDLESSGTFNINNYPWDYYGLYKSPQIANFVEWCYSPFNSGDFALYIYFYNPQNLKIDTESASNKIQMASAYSSYPITRESVPTDYDNYELVFCSMSTRENLEGLFYKFRVVDHKGTDGMFIHERVYSGERRYDVSSVTFATLDGNVKDVGAGGTYFFTGYAAGYGPSATAESTLICSDYRALETISIDVHPTYYRQAGWSELGKGHQWDINSVYFSIPERYFENYGNLQKIKAEWYEYETTDMLVGNDKTAIDAFLPYAGVEIPFNTFNDPLGFPSYNSGLRYCFIGTESLTDFEIYGYNVANNALSDYTGWVNYNYYQLTPQINYFFHTNNVITSSSSDTLVTSQQLVNYMKSYNATFKKGFLPVELDGKKISADLFKDSLSTERTAVAYVGDDIHHKVVEFDANDKFNMLSYDSTQSDWERFWHNIFGGTPIDEQVGVSPIISDVSNYIELNDSNLSKTLLINENDAKAFKTFYQSAKDKVNPERTILFRFAKTDYKTQMGSTLRYKDGTDKTENYNNAKDAVLASQSVFLNFDIIKLTFLDESGTYTAIPVVSDPLDIVNDVSSRPGSEGGILNDIWQTIKDFFTMLGNVLGFLGVLVLGIVAIIVIVWIVLFLLRIINIIPSTLIKTILYIVLAVVVLGVLILALPFWVEQLVVLGGTVFV